MDDEKLLKLWEDSVVRPTVAIFNFRPRLNVRMLIDNGMIWDKSRLRNKIHVP